MRDTAELWQLQLQGVLQLCAEHNTAGAPDTTALACPGLGLGMHPLRIMLQHQTGLCMNSLLPLAYAPLSQAERKTKASCKAGTAQC
eukprot:CAMPEP_0202898976 /NCGR_PEP_ID=MMETSP1392-20130828/7344_1 /ASSEMBLY_ACC=CAM_ASM_000868 /TAXON_ID=225041 /ORGANISM="Chlamydomonas chlamydogama, Strain SAG 11-48b" /LENGTH=86 /DNA_ID=CAMNT_0049585051 /DNA_START=308 /DNA_END=569 /DNA_ORIENTATION=-